jgi:P-type Cu+ transporter
MAGRGAGDATAQPPEVAEAVRAPTPMPATKLETNIRPSSSPTPPPARVRTPEPARVSLPTFEPALASMEAQEPARPILDPELFEEDTANTPSLPDAVFFAALALSVLTLLLVFVPSAQGMRAGLAAFALVVSLVVLTHPFARLRFAAGGWSAAALALLLVVLVWSLLRPSGSSEALASLAGAACLVYLLLHRWTRVESARMDPDLRGVSLLAHASTGATREIRARDIRETDLLEIGPGDRLPLDVRVESGSAMVEPWHECDQIRRASAGDTLSAGATCKEGTLVVRPIARDPLWFSFPTEPSDVVLSGRTSRRIEFAFVACALGAALLSCIVQYVATRHGPEAVAAALSVFLAIPVPVLRASLAALYSRGAANARKAGSLFSGSGALEHAFGVDTIVICGRSGLLTRSPERIALERFPERNGERVEEQTILDWVGEAEVCARESSLGQALATSAGSSVRKAQFEAGRGVSAELVTGAEILMGSRAFMLEKGIGTAQADQRAAEIGCTERRLMYIARSSRVVAFMAFSEAVKPEARAAIERLHDADIEPVLLSSESLEVCERSAKDLGIDHVRADIAFELRADEVTRVAESGRTVSVLGHPANDLAPLHAAHLALLRPSNAHFESRDGVWLLSDDLRTAAFGLAAAKETWASTKRLVFTLALPGALATLAIALGFAPVWAGPLAAMLSGVLAVSAARVRGSGR